MAGHSTQQTFWAHHNAQQRPAANVKPGHKDTNLYYHFRAPNVALCLFLNRDLGGIGTYLTGYRGESKSVVQPRLAQHQHQLMSALAQAAALNNDVARQQGDMYGDYSVFHEIDIDDPQNRQQISDWFENVRQVYMGVLGAPSLPQGGGLKQK
ncbi:MAG: hypothetical protein OXE50_14635 [Chloroflexi bacterium]|nr:hypothetical protein [Chloroflexota bacterium]